MALSSLITQVHVANKEINELNEDKIDLQNEEMEITSETEKIANEYSEATSNQIYVCKVSQGTSTPQQETMTLDTLAKSITGVGGESQMIVIADARGNAIFGAKAETTWGSGGSGSGGSTAIGYKMTYYEAEDGGNLKETPATSGKAKQLKELFNANSKNSVLQTYLPEGGYQLLIEDTGVTDETAGDTSGDGGSDVKFHVDGSASGTYFQRKLPESLTGTSQRYYTEDDAAQQAEYQSKMSRLTRRTTLNEQKQNKIDTKITARTKERDGLEEKASTAAERVCDFKS